MGHRVFFFVLFWNLPPLYTSWTLIFVSCSNSITTAVCLSDCLFVCNTFWKRKPWLVESGNPGIVLTQKWKQSQKMKMVPKRPPQKWRWAQKLSRTQKWRQPQIQRRPQKLRWPIKWKMKQKKGAPVIFVIVFLGL